jgi:hypothetical protein
MLEKIKSLQVNFALVAFGCFMVKVLVFSATIPDSIILLGLGGLYGYSQYLKRFQPYKLDEAVMRDLLEVKTALTKINMIRSAEKMTEKKYF